MYNDDHDDDDDDDDDDMMDAVLDMAMTLSSPQIAQRKEA
jgi:hypothetical protein